MNSNETYNKFLAKNYDSFYSEKHLHKNTALAILNFLQNVGITKKDKILDIGCGIGNHVAIIAKEGFSITGIDISPDMIKEAKEKHPQITSHLIHTSTEKLSETFHAVYAITNVINCLENINQLKEFIKAASNRLAPRGLFLFDTWNAKVIISNPPQYLSDRTYYKNKTIDRTVSPRLNVKDQIVFLDYNYTIEQQQTNVSHRIKLFSENEIFTALLENDFKIKRIFTNIIDKNTEISNSRGIFYVAQKQ